MTTETVRLRQATDRGELDAITPVILSFNEEANISRCLESLGWATRVVILDSGSQDATERIARQFVNVDWRVRPFDSHGKQWHHAILETDIATEYVLALDADMAITPGALAELEQCFLPGRYAGGIFSFDFRICGAPLASSLYPSDIRVFRRSAIEVRQNGHTQQFVVPGSIYTFKYQLVHDDRKNVDQFARSQLNYSRLERDRLNTATMKSPKDRLRWAGVMPLIAGPLAYLRAGGPFRGKASLYYAYERTTYELLLAMRTLREGAAASKHEIASESSDGSKDIESVPQ